MLLAAGEEEEEEEQEIRGAEPAVAGCKEEGDEVEGEDEEQGTRRGRPRRRPRLLWSRRG